MAAREFHVGFPPEKSIETGLAEGFLTEDDRDLILEFVAEREAVRDITSRRRAVLISHMVVWRRFLKSPYRSATIGDVFSAVTAIKTGNNQKGRPYKINTISILISDLRTFFLWLVENGYSSIPVKKLRRLRPPQIDANVTQPEEILTYEEIKKMVSVCRTARDRAFVMTLYESGCRISEVARIEWRDIEFDQYGVKLRIRDRKEKKIRYARLTMAAEHLAEWKSNTQWNAPDRLAFVTRRGDSFTYDTCRHLLRGIMVRADIPVRSRTHLFRHSRTTHMIKQNIQESVIKKSLWGNVNTKMFKHYVNLGENDIDNEILGKSGVQRRVDEEKPLMPRTCGRCHTVCSPVSEYCHKCGEGLTDEAIVSKEKIVETIRANPEILIREYLSQVQEPEDLILRILAERRASGLHPRSPLSEENTSVPDHVHSQDQDG